MRCVMRKVILTSLALCLVLAAGRAPAADPDQAKAILDRAMQAAGGEANLAKFQAATGRAKGTLHKKEGDVPYTTEAATQGADRARLVTEFRKDGKPLKVVIVIDGDKGWVKTGDEATVDMDEAVLKEIKEWLYASWLTTLAPLRDKAFELSPLGESKEDGRAAVGLKVAHKGHRDVELFFDKDTGLLARVKSRIKDLENNREVTQEIRFDQYKDFQGTKQRTKMTTRWDGKPRDGGELTEIRLSEKLPDKVFGKP
jgi:hypothetical protein